MSFSFGSYMVSLRLCLLSLYISLSGFPTWLYSAKALAEIASSLASGNEIYSQHIEDIPRHKPPTQVEDFRKGSLMLTSNKLT